jgi:hypothetical protein
MAISSQSELFLKLQAGVGQPKTAGSLRRRGGTCQARIRSSTCKEFIQRIPYSVSGLDPFPVLFLVLNRKSDKRNRLKTTISQEGVAAETVIAVGGRLSRRTHHPRVSARGPQCMQKVHAARASKRCRSAPRPLPPTPHAERNGIQSADTPRALPGSTLRTIRGEQCNVRTCRRAASREERWRESEPLQRAAPRAKFVPSGFLCCSNLYSRAACRTIRNYSDERKLIVKPSSLTVGDSFQVAGTWNSPYMPDKRAELNPNPGFLQPTQSIDLNFSVDK